jgi:protein-tyrosine-phosphatase
MALLPPTVQARAREMRGLSGNARRAHMALALRRWVLRREPPMVENAGPRTSVLFVCHGNIIRSAMAEAMLRRHMTARTGEAPFVRSAGVAADEGRPADPRAVAAALSHGVSLAAHRSSPLTSTLVNESDVIFIMDRLNEAEVAARFPAARAKLRRLGALALDPSDDDIIPDPYSLDADAVAASGARIDAAVRALTDLLATGRRETPR